jgi:hypothetical protein
VGEKRSLADERPDVVQRLRKLHDEWLRQCDSQTTKRPQP